MTNLLAVVAVLVLAACTRGGAEPAREREVARVSAEVAAAPRGVRPVNGGPVCVLRERSGGAYGRPRHVVDVTTRGLLRLPPSAAADPVFYAVEVEAAGRVYRGWVSTTSPEPNDEAGLIRLPPMRLADEFTDLRVAPENHMGVQEVNPPLTACRLTITPPDKADAALGGRLVGVQGDDPVVIDPEGTMRGIAEA